MNIMGESECTPYQMAQYLISKNPLAAPWALAYAQLYLEEGQAEGVRFDGAWIQSCKETGNFKFTGGTAVTFEQNNFCGLGVTKKGMKGHSFAAPRLGIRAQIQHLKGYASPLPLNNACVDPRYPYIQPKGKAPRFEDLAGKWAVPGYDTSRASSLTDAMEKKIGYGFDIIAGIEEMKKLAPSHTELTIKTNWADKSNYGSPRSTDSIQYLVIHYTGNDGDSDEANGNYFANNRVKTSAHYFVDDDSITQSVPDNYRAYHCGASKYYHPQCRNANSIGIEMCDTKKNGAYDVTEKTLANTLELAKRLMETYQIPIQNVLRHYDVTHKHCPAYFVSDETAWQNFKSRLGEASENPAVPKSPAVPDHSTHSAASTTSLRAAGLQYAESFTGVDDSAHISRAKGRVLQRAMNLDYGKTLEEDGVIGPKSKKKLAAHYVQRGERQYMVTAAEILMYLNNLDPQGVELPGIYGNGLAKAAKAVLGGSGQKITSSDFLTLVKN